MVLGVKAVSAELKEAHVAFVAGISTEQSEHQKLLQCESSEKQVLPRSMLEGIASLCTCLSAFALGSALRDATYSVKPEVLVNHGRDIQRALQVSSDFEFFVSVVKTKLGDGIDGEEATVRVNDAVDLMQELPTCVNQMLQTRRDLELLLTHLHHQNPQSCMRWRRYMPAFASASCDLILNQAPTGN